MLFAAAAILAGFIILIWSADLFVDGAASIAENLGMPPIIIGMTIVSLGTSAPEVLVSINASISGSGPLAIGNAIGSNIANLGMVLGATLLVTPLMVHHTAMKKEVPLLLIATFGTGALILDGVLTALNGWLMVAALGLIMIHMVRSQIKDTDLTAEVAEEPLPHLKPLRAWMSFILGLILLIASSRILVFGAVMAAKELGVSELVIGLTIVAIGTSLPELAATIASALRGHTEIALGNVIGSNLFNLLAVMSIPGIITLQELDRHVLLRDYPAMTFMTVFLAAAIYSSRWRRKSPADHAYLGRIVGVLLVSFYALYYYWLHATL
jgi:cation:H+ antiporter